MRFQMKLIFFISVTIRDIFKSKNLQTLSKIRVQCLELKIKQWGT
jgi:hypothetical protein